MITVYLIRIGNLMKIGQTHNLKIILSQYLSDFKIQPELITCRDFKTRSLAKNVESFLVILAILLKGEKVKNKHEFFYHENKIMGILKNKIHSIKHDNKKFKLNGFFNLKQC